MPAHCLLLLLFLVVITIPTTFDSPFHLPLLSSVVLEEVLLFGVGKKWKEGRRMPWEIWKLPAWAVGRKGQ